MKSIQHVLWRGALALSLMAIGVGSGLGMPPVEQVGAPNDCPADTRAVAAVETGSDPVRDSEAITLLVQRRALSPAG